MASVAPPDRRTQARVRRFRSPSPFRGRISGRTDTASTVEHLEELRWRLVSCLIVLVGGFIAAYAIADQLFTVLNRPLNGQFRVQTLAVTEPFFTTVSVAAKAAFILTFPVLVWNSYRYLSPALEPWQRRTLRPLVLAAPALFMIGVAFCYSFVLGPAVRFLLSLGAGSFDVAVRAQDYYGFVGTTLLAMGLVFQFPLVVVGLGRMGVLTAARLRSNRKVAVVLMVVVAALLPTADPVSLLIETLPLMALFELSILLVALQERAARRRQGADTEQA